MHTFIREQKKPSNIPTSLNILAIISKKFIKKKNKKKSILFVTSNNTSNQEKNLNMNKDFMNKRKMN